MLGKNFLRVLLIIIGALTIGMLFKYLDESPDDYISSSEADKFRIMNYYESGKSVGRIALLEYIERYENDSLKVDLRILQALEDSIQTVELKERFGASLYE